MAPELLKHQPYQGPPIDIWNLGELLYYMVVGKMPLESENPKELTRNIAASKYEIFAKLKLSNSVTSLIKACLSSNPG